MTSASAARESETGTRGSPPALRVRSAARLRWVAGVLLAFGVLAVFAARPALVAYHLRRGRVELGRQNVEAAGEHFQAAERIDPESAETHFWRARVSRKLGDLEGVREHLEKARQLGFEDQQRLKREWWLVLAETGRVRQVEQYLPEMLTSAGEDDLEICAAFATGFCLDMRFDEALVLLDAWEADYPKDFRPHLRRGQIYAGDHQWPTAAAAFRKALKLAPDDATVRRGLAEVLAQLGESEEAESHFRVAVREDPADVEALLGLAAVLKQRDSPAEAATFARRALEQKPHSFRAKLLLAELTLLEGDAERAVNLATPLVESWPRDLRSRYVLAEALRAAGRGGEAEAHAKTYAELQRHAQQVERTLRQRLHLRPDDAENRYQLGQYVLDYVSRAEGVSWLQSVLQYEPQHAGAHAALARYYEKVGDRELARRHRRGTAGSLPKGTEKGPASLTERGSLK